MKIKFLTMSCISGLSLAMLAGCSDSNPAMSDFYNIGEGIASSDSENQAIPTSNTSGSSDSGSSMNVANSSDSGLNASSNSNVSVSSSSANTPASSAGNGTSSASNGTSSAVTASSSSVAPIVNSSSSTIPTVQSSSSVPATQSSSSTPTQQVISNGETPVITYAASGATVANTNNCVTVTGGTVTITCGGEYDFNGSYSGSDAQILVNTAKTDTSVYLNMKGLTLTNTADAPIYVQKASKAFVVAKNGTTNTFTDGASRTKKYTYTNDSGEAKTDTTGACI